MFVANAKKLISRFADIDVTCAGLLLVAASVSKLLLARQAGDPEILFGRLPGDSVLKTSLSVIELFMQGNRMSGRYQGNRMSGRYGLRIARSPFQSSRRVGDSISGTEEIHGIGTCGSRLQSF